MKNLSASKTAKAKKLLLIFLTLILFQLSLISYSQTVIQVGASKTYTTISAAYTSIATPMTTSYIIELESDYSPELSVTLTAKSGASATNYIVIAPALNISKTITGTSTNGTIYLNGATYVTIDGTRGGGTASLTISNTSTSGMAILYKNGATYNVIQNCTIKGRNNTASSGVISINTSTGATGNCFNTITNNTITTDNTSNRPLNLICSNGTSGKLNSDNTISKNYLYDFVNYAILITMTGNGNNWTIGGNNSGDGNHIYETFSDNKEQTGIYFKPGSASTGNLIKYNFIGGSAPNCGGSYWANSGAYPLVGIKANVSTAGYGATISYNTVKNISMTNTSDVSYFYGIYPDSGSMIIDHNTIGDDVTANSITSSSKGLVSGIFSESLYDVDITNNLIANITMTSNASTGMELRGITHENTIGAAHFTITITGNTVHDLKSNGTQDYTYDGVIYGIAYRDSSANSIGEIGYNHIYNLNAYNNVNAGTNVYLGGIELDMDAYNVKIYNNKIHDLFNATLTNPMMGGIIVHIDEGRDAPRYVNIYNNMITLSANQNVQMYGIWDFGVYWSQTMVNSVYMNVYYNTIYISGTVPSGNAGTACYCRGLVSVISGSFDTESITKLKNNIFINTRTGGTGNHLAVINCIFWDPAWDASWPYRAKYGWDIDYSNYNFIVTASLSSVYAWGTNTPQILTFSGLQNLNNCDTTCPQDVNSWYIASSSINLANLFVNPSAGDLSINNANSEAWYVKGKGVAGVLSGSLNTDYFGNTRVTTYGLGTCVGAHEFTTSTTPPAPTISSSIAVGNTQNVTQAGRTLGSIYWLSGSALPSAVNFEYHSGTNPPGNGFGNYGNCYWKITQTGGTNYSYTITLNYDPAETGTISGENYIRIAKSEDGINWTHYGTATVNTTNKTVSFTFNSFSYFSIDDQNSPLPVELSSFTYNIDARNVLLKWQTNKEANNSGFDIQRNDNNIWKSIGFVEGQNKEQNNYSFTDKNLISGTYKYRLKQIDYNGNYRFYDLNHSVIIGTPDKFSLMQNYPNPFNPVTRISYNLPVNSYVSLKVFDISGKEVTALVNENQVPGYYDIEFSSNKYNLSSGVYFYRIQAGNFAEVKRMMLIK